MMNASSAKSQKKENNPMPKDNVRAVCDAHAPRQGRFTGTKPETFLGGMVKLAFKAINPTTGNETLEHMWVEVTELVTSDVYQNGESLIGRLYSEPVLQCDYASGDELAFKVEEIEAFADPGVQ